MVRRWTVRRSDGSLSESYLNYSRAGLERALIGTEYDTRALDEDSGYRAKFDEELRQRLEDDELTIVRVEVRIAEIDDN